MKDRIWRSQNQSYLRPLPERLGVSSRGRSRRLDRVLTDFGCEHSFARAADRVLEHYGFEIGVSATRTATLEHAQRARAKLQAEYAEPFRVLPAVGSEHVIAQADGTMICTVQAGPRKGKRPREWKEMRLVAAQAKGSATTVYGATFGSVEETGRRWGHCTRQAGWGLNLPRFKEIRTRDHGALELSLECMPDRPLTVEHSESPVGPWVGIHTLEPRQSSINLEVPSDIVGKTFFFRAFQALNPDP